MTARSSLGDRVSGLAAEAAFFMILSLPLALLALLGGIGSSERAAAAGC